MPSAAWATSRSASPAASTKWVFSSRSSGGYPVSASSGKRTSRAPSSRASPIMSRTRAELPLMSPTVAFIWASATRSGSVRIVMTRGVCALRGGHVGHGGLDAARQLVRRHAEQRVAVAARRPDLIVVEQRLVEDHRQVVAERGHAADGEAGGHAHLVDRKRTRLKSSHAK